MLRQFAIVILSRERPFDPSLVVVFGLPSGVDFRNDGVAIGQLSTLSVAWGRVANGTGLVRH